MKPNYKKGLNFADLKLLGVTAMTNAGHKAQWGYNSSEDFLFCFQNCSDLFVRKKCLCSQVLVTCVKLHLIFKKRVESRKRKLLNFRKGVFCLFTDIELSYVAVTKSGIIFDNRFHYRLCKRFHFKQYYLLPKYMVWFNKEPFTKDGFKGNDSLIS